jgi:ATP-binding cassette subfamily B protein
MKKSRTYSDFEIYRRLFAQAKPYGWHLGALLVVSLLATPLSLLLPLPLKIAVDSAIGSAPVPSALAPFFPAKVGDSSLSLMIAVAMLLIVVGFLIHVQSFAVWVLNTYVGEKLILDLRARMLRHLQRMSLAYHDVQGTTDSVYRVQYDTEAIQLVSVYGLIPLTVALVTLLGMIWVIAAIDWHIALIALAVCPVLYWLTDRARGRMRQIWEEIKRYESSSMSVVEEVLSGIRIVKTFTQEEREQERFIAASRRSMGGQIRVALIQGRFDVSIGLTLVGGEAVVLFVGVQHVQAGTLSLGNLLIIMSYLAQLYDPLKSISKCVGGLQTALASAGRVFSVLDEEREVLEKPHAKRCSRALGAIRFERVSFGYEKGALVLQNVDFDVAPQQRVGIVGKTGTGKSTLVSLIARFYDPVSGRILLDGTDLRDYRLTDLRKQLAFVLQETMLFSTTIRENIAYANAAASEQAIVAAAKAADAHDFIVSLPGGYNTQVGERGVLLSGGERQRISLARAFLKNAPILILDEPTSAVDVDTENAILEAMERLMRDRTTFIIAHRPSTLARCDIVLRVEGGRVLAQSSALKAAGAM